MGEKVREGEALAKPDEGGLRAHFRARIDPFSSLVLTAPVFVLYHIGILFSDTRNGVDLFTSWMVRLVEQDMRIYVLVTLGLALAIVGAGFVLRRRGVLRPVAFAPVVIESLGWALLLWLSVGWATQRLLDLQTGAEGVGFFGAFVVSAGAGFHEELVFRAGLFSGSRKLLKHFTDLPAAVPWVLASVLSATLFSLAHYVGALGDDFSWASFIFRALMGLMLAGIYQLRGFAVAVYAHAFYDVLYFLVLR